MTYEENNQNVSHPMSNFRYLLVDLAVHEKLLKDDGVSLYAERCLVHQKWVENSRSSEGHKQAAQDHENQHH